MTNDIVLLDFGDTVILYATVERAIFPIGLAAYQ